MLVIRFVTLLLFPLLLWGQVEWVEYKEALIRAKNENKTVMLMVEKEGCPYCKTMSDEVLIRPEVLELLNKHFVASRAMLDDQNIPSKVTIVPTFLFVDPETSLVYKKVAGAWKAPDFVDFLNMYKKDK